MINLVSLLKHRALRVLFQSLNRDFTGFNQAQIDKFLKAKAIRSPKTVAFYRSSLDRYLEFAGGQWPPTPELITGFLVHGQSRGLAPNTVSAYFRAIRAWCNWLYKNDVIDTNPIDYIDAPRQPHQKEPKAADPGQLASLIRHLENLVDTAFESDTLRDSWIDIRDLSIISILLDTGLRVGEVERVRVEHINLKKSSIFTPTSKSGESRTVVFGSSTKDDLLLWLEVRATLPQDNPSLFISWHRGHWKPFSHWGIRQMLVTRCEKLGLHSINPHSLRHSFASQSLKNGSDLEFLREQLGHSSIKMTAIYTKRTPDDMLAIQGRTSPRNLIGGAL